jgi:uncharacterized protein YndB with AHSA1/START domain
MDKKANKSITVETTVNAPVEKAWQCWTEPEHITKWNFASDDWESPAGENDLRTGGKFKARMQAKDGSAGFDFGGTYTNVKTNEVIEYDMDDNRHVKVEFTPVDGGTKVTETFDMENTHSEELQRNGWQAILNNFKKHTESI